MSCYLQFHDIFEKTIPMKTLALYSFVSFFLSPASRLQYSGSDTKIYFSGLRGGGGGGEKFVCRAGIHKHLGNPNLLDPMVWKPDVGTLMHFALSRISDLLKGQCHEIFDLYFFHESNPSGPLINRLKWFFLKFVFAKIFKFKVRIIRLRAG